MTAELLRPHEQFRDLSQQREVATLGIWVFLASEMLFFGGMWAAYYVYRLAYPAAFRAAASRTEITIGAINTAILLTSAFVMSLADHVATARLGRRWLILCLTATLLLGLTFLGLKGLEYSHDYAKHLVPGVNFSFPGPLAGPAELFWVLYFAMTGIHMVHLLAGLGLVLSLIIMAARGRFDTGYSAPVEIVGLYWHFVDLVWILLFAILYLPGRAP